jgi:hypothetical protein
MSVKLHRGNRLIPSLPRSALARSRDSEVIGMAPPKPAPTGGAELPDAMEAMKPLVASLSKEHVKRIVDLQG